MKSKRGLFLKSIYRAKSVLFFIVYFFALLSYGVDERDYKNLSPSVAMVYDRDSLRQGSGFFITENLLVTNYHAVENLIHDTHKSVYMEVITPRKMEDFGRVLVVDRQNDLAIIKTVTNDNYTPLTLGNDRDIIRDRSSFTIGYPFLDLIQQVKGISFEELPFQTYPGTEKSIKVAFSEGFIGMRVGNELFYTTAFTEIGSSGSPVFSQDLKVIGVVRSIIVNINPQQTVVVPIHKLKTLIEENKELLKREGVVGLGRISPESVKRRVLHADVKTAEDMFLLGMWYNDNIRSNLQETRYWYTKAAERGYKYAQNDLGFMYSRGLGGERDFQKARYWYKKAAEQGYKLAQNELGIMYLEGLGVERDFQKARYWYEKAAEQGYKKAQYNLALLYAKGQGVRKNLLKALYWKRKYKQSQRCY